MSRNNPYKPPESDNNSRLPKYQEPLIDWAGLIIIIGSLFVIGTFTLLAILLFGKT
jgi:hypothetical protein